VAFVSAVVFVIGIAVLVLLAEPPGVVVGIIAVVVVGVLVRSFVSSSVWGCARQLRIGTRAAGKTPDAIAEPES
jgi:hypothetical protein